MKKTVMFVISIMFTSVTQCFALSSPTADFIKFQPDTSNERTAEITLSATPGTITTITVPNDAIGFRLYPRTNHIRFAVNASVSAVATVATDDQTVAAADLAVGGIAKNDTWETRLLPAGTSRTVSLRSTTASVVVDFEVF